MRAVAYIQNYTPPLELCIKKIDLPTQTLRPLAGRGKKNIYIRTIVARFMSRIQPIHLEAISRAEFSRAIGLKREDTLLLGPPLALSKKS